MDLTLNFSAKYFFTLFFIFFPVFQECYSAYTPPSATVEPLHPRGIRLSVPDEDGITLVAFHVKFNEEFYSLEAGTIAVDIIKTRNGQWVYEDRTTRLKLGDIVYYWVHVVYDGLGYNLLDQQHVVKEFYNYDGSPANAPKLEGDCTNTSDSEIIDNSGTRRKPCPGELLFEDNFDRLDTTRWTVIERFSGVPDYEFVVYMNSNENVEVKDGNLHIKPVLVCDKYDAGYVRRGSMRLDKCTGKAGTPECQRDAIGPYILPPVISGRLNTKASFNFLYGRVEIRAKLPRGDWIYPLITLEKRNPSGEGEPYQEIRIASVSGNTNLMSPNGTDISGHLLYAGGLTVTLSNNHVQSSNRVTLPSKLSESYWFDDYHTYEIEWRRGKISVKVDGNPYGMHNAPSFNSHFYINLGLAVGGHGEFPDMSTSGTFQKPWRNVGSKAVHNFYVDRENWQPSWQNQDNGLHVDYVKVWAL